jgi:type VI secretion system secreted protein VgrG
MLPTDTLPMTLKSPLPDGQLSVRWMTGHEELGRLFEYELEIHSERGDVVFDALLGKPLTVCVAKEQGVRFFNGIVTRLMRVGDIRDFFVFRAILSPKLWLLTRTRDCRVYQDQTVPEVVKSILREHVVPFSEKLSTDSYRRWDYLTQYRESDFAFVSRLLEQEGIYYYFKHDLDKHELVLADSVSSHEPVPGYERIPVRPPGTAVVKQDHFTEWRSVHQGTSAQVTLQDHDFRLRRGSDIKVFKGVGSEHEQDELEIYDHPGEYVVAENQEDADAAATRQAGEHYALARLDEQRSELARVEGSGNARGVEAGALIRIDTLDELNNEYLVVATQYEVRNAELRSGQPAEDEMCRLSFNGIESKRQFRPARSTKKPVIPGPQTAIVVGKKGEEIWTDKYGRVKVHFHWDREGQEDETSSCWVRVGQIWAGTNWGSIHIPRIGHEVIVQFLEGDPDRPLITGAVYNIDNMPPYDLPASATQSGIKSRSTRGGTPQNFNEIRFEDKKGSEELHVQAEKDMSTLVKNNRSMSVGGNETYSVTGTRNLTITKKDTQKFEDERDITVALADTHTINGLRTEHYNKGRERDVKEFDNTTVNAANKNTTVHGQYTITADEHYKVQQGGNQLFIKNEVLAESVGQIQLKNQQCHLDLKDGKMTLTAAKEITLQCGPTSLTLKSDGTVALTGPQQVTASSGASGLKVEPAGATMSGPKATVSGVGLTEITGALIKVN